ncbi:aminopeptidase P family protein [Anaerococcus sp.]|uniref:aminopeptidase P family protein n=1 Tax=Anaerococcus sp. TaxID=1872515 RepID=UPI0027BA4A4E|nr:aminopeptidase P family protein [Anaerococcus sp.]
MNINERLEKLRNLMKERNIDAYIVPTSDPHQSEYLSDFYRTREFITGFTGSAGTALITMDDALLWTDSRYFLQAAKELKHSEFKLMKMGVEGVPNLIEYLDENIGEFGKIAFDGKSFSVKAYKDLSESMGARILVSDVDYISQIWTDRPSLRKDKAWIMEDKYAGESISQKLLRLRNIMADRDYDYTFIGSPEDICYLLNIRGNDIDYNPVLLSYSLISKDEAYLCIDEEKIPGEVSDYLEANGVKLYSYDSIFKLLNNIAGKNRIFLDPERTNVAIYDSINSNVKVSLGTNITTDMKAIKTDVEIENIKKAYIKDGIALTKFFSWLEIGAKTGNLNELLASKKLQDLRKEDESYIEDSFETIAGYKENAAIVHYAPQATGSKTIKNEGMILVDSGAHYKEGTTDITRTVALGRLTDQEKTDYTLVLKSFLSLFLARFKDKTNGQRLDAIAKYPLWQAGKDFFHGTGHGVGFVLTVHEGPQRISERDDSQFVENMTTSIEPGLYIENSHGIRIENEAYVKRDMENEFGKFNQFESLTYVPIDTRPVKTEMLNRDEIDLLNEYNKNCFEKLSPYLEGAELEYLKESCKAI